MTQPRGAARQARRLGAAGAGRSEMAGFVIGLFLGAAIGLLVVSLLVAARESEAQHERE